MKIKVTIEVLRDDGTTLIREDRAETQRIWRMGGWAKETRPEIRKRIDRLVTTSLNATVGGR